MAAVPPEQSSLMGCTRIIIVPGRSDRRGGSLTVLSGLALCSCVSLTRSQRHRKRKSQRCVNGCNASRSPLRCVEAAPEPALAIQIVNAREIGATEKVLRVVRDDTGKMTGL